MSRSARVQGVRATAAGATPSSFKIRRATDNREKPPDEASGGAGVSPHRRCPGQKPPNGAPKGAIYNVLSRQLPAPRPPLKREARTADDPPEGFRPAGRSASPVNRARKQDWQTGLTNRTGKQKWQTGGANRCVWQRGATAVSIFPRLACQPSMLSSTATIMAWSSALARPETVMAATTPTPLTRTGKLPP